MLVICLLWAFVLLYRSNKNFDAIHEAGLFSSTKKDNMWLPQETHVILRLQLERFLCRLEEKDVNCLAENCCRHRQALNASVHWSVKTLFRHSSY